MFSGIKNISFWIEIHLPVRNPEVPGRFSSADSAIIYQHCGCDLKGVSVLNQSEIETGICLFCLFFRFFIKKVIKELLYLKSVDFLQSSKKCFTLVYYKIQNPRTLLQAYLLAATFAQGSKCLCRVAVSY